MTDKTTLGLLFGGRSGEHEVSLMSARSVMDALDTDHYQVLQIGITKEGHWRSGPDLLQAFTEGDYQAGDRVTILPEPGSDGLFLWSADQPLALVSKLDVVFPVLHGTFGEDGTVQGLLELADVAYVGAGVLASSVAMDKGLFKRVMQAHYIPVLPWTVLQGALIDDDIQEVIRLAEAVGAYPLFVKPANMGSSVGVSKAANRSDLMEGLLEARQFDRRIVVEQGIEAREIEVSVIGNEDPQASIPGEVVPGADFYSYQAKYIDDTSDLLIPAPLDPETTEEIRRLAVQAYAAIDGAGFARVDFLLEKSTNKIYMNEINTIPGFTKISMFPKLWEASGLDYRSLVQALIDYAVARQAQKTKLSRSYEGAA
ncbi:MAG: D-alanine--D-alanine ligase family protein [Anaerolineales bacterium]|jgi:D-alanine-D-alanine ligase